MENTYTVGVVVLVINSDGQAEVVIQGIMPESNQENLVSLVEDELL